MVPPGSLGMVFLFLLGRCRRSGLFGAVAEEDIGCQVAAVGFPKGFQPSTVNEKATVLFRCGYSHSRYLDLSMTIWQSALANRSRALLPSREASKRLNHSTTPWLVVNTKLETRWRPTIITVEVGGLLGIQPCRPRSFRISRSGAGKDWNALDPPSWRPWPGSCPEEIVGVYDADAWLARMAA